jgi:hypothetical protein
MFDIIPFYPVNQENPEGWLAGWVILQAKFNSRDKTHPWHVQIYNLYNHWSVPSIFDTWQYCNWAQ